MRDKPIYLAAPWIDKDEMPARAKFFEDAGYRITHKWWEYEGESQEAESPQFLLNCALQDYHGVINGDAVVVFNTAKSEGKAVEQGIAIASGIPIVIINPPIKVTNNIFHHLHLYTHVNSMEEALEPLQKHV